MLEKGHDENKITSLFGVIRIEIANENWFQ